MRYIYILIFFLSSDLCAHEYEETHKFECNGNKNREGIVEQSYFNKEEEEIVRSIRQTDKPIIYEEFNKKSISMDQKNAISIEWDQAKRIILMGYAKAILQGSLPKPHAYILGGSGHTYIVTPPEGESVYILASIVDPCSVYITRSMY
ncbi:hypothetical protein SAMN02745866_04283 [Alteromonadaceae bacterium Bs31]|nr:hypothetical protein SAMN02745866_04283 [Alteromonadaceae bacterium Bs31]